MFDRNKARLAAIFLLLSTVAVGSTISKRIEAETVSIADDILAEKPGTLVEVAESDVNFGAFAVVLAAAGLTEMLEGEGPFTIFAPTDDAFYSLPAGQLEALLQAENRDQLAALLSHHVVPGKVLSADFEEGQAQTVEGSPIYITLDDGVSIDDANVVEADIPASNGVIHAVDAVILPKEIFASFQE